MIFRFDDLVDPEFRWPPWSEFEIQRDGCIRVQAFAWSGLYRSRLKSGAWSVWRTFGVSFCPVLTCPYCRRLGSRRWIQARLEMYDAFGLDERHIGAYVCGACWRKSRFASLRRAVRRLSDLYDNERLIRKLQREIAKCRKAKSLQQISAPPASSAPHSVGCSPA